MSKFPITRWSLLEAARDATSDQYQEALNVLIERYWMPVYLYVRRRGYSHEDAKDLTQEFFTGWLVRGSFGQANALRGRFRNFLLASLNNFLVNAHRDAQAHRRRPSQGFVAIENLLDGAENQSGGADRNTPEVIFHRAWAVELIQRVLGQLAQHLEQTGKSIHHEIFRRRIIEPFFDGAEVESMKTLSQRLGLSEKQVANHLLMVKRAFTRLLQEEVRFYAASEEEIDSELQGLFRLLEHG